MPLFDRRDALSARAIDFVLAVAERVLDALATGRRAPSPVLIPASNELYTRFQSDTAYGTEAVDTSVAHQ